MKVVNFLCAFFLPQSVSVYVCNLESLDINLTTYI